MAIERREVGASLVGGALGGVVLVVVVAVAAPSTLRGMGAVVGAPSLATGAGVVLGTSLVFGLAFVGVVTRYTDRYVSTVLGITTRSTTAKDLVMPLTRRFGMALVVTTAMGLLYGLVLGVVVGGIVGSTLATTVGVLNPAVVLGSVLYGVVLGGTYGKLVMG